MFLYKQFFDWNHFKEKLALRFPKQTYAKFSVVDAQITRILALLQKMEDKCSSKAQQKTEDKCSSKAQQILVEDARISSITVLNGVIGVPLATDNSSSVDNSVSYPGLFATSVDAHSGHVDHMFDEMSTGIFTKEGEETSSVSNFVVDAEDIQSPKVFDEFIHSCCLKTIVEVQIETPTKMVDEEAADPESSAVQLFEECSLRDISKRYITAPSLDHGSRTQKIAFETFDDMYLIEFSLEPETIKDLYLENSHLKIKESIPPGIIPSDKMLLGLKHGKSTYDFNALSIWCQFSFNPTVNSSLISFHGIAMNLCVWDPGIHFNSMTLTGYTYTVNMHPLKLLGFIDKFWFIAFTNSVNRVWDPGLQRYEMVVMESEVHGTYSEVNRVFNDSFLRVASTEIQLITPLDNIRLPKLFRFLQRLLAQLIEGDFSFQKNISDQARALKMAPEGKEVKPIFCFARLQGCVKSTINLTEQKLRYFSRFEVIIVFFGARGVPASCATCCATCPALEFEYILVVYGADDFIILIRHDILDRSDIIIDFPTTSSLYEFAALQACENDHWCLTRIKSKLELVKGALVVDAYVVHKSILDESKSISILISSEKFKSKMRLVCSLAHFGSQRRAEEFTVTQRIQLVELGKTSSAAMGPSLLAISQAFLVIIRAPNHQCFPLPCGTSREAYVFGGDTGTKCSAFLVNTDHSRKGVTVQFRNSTYELPPKSISILPDCKTVAFNTAKVSTQFNTRTPSPVFKFDKWEQFQEVIPQFDSTTVRSQTLLEQTNTTKDVSDYLWYTASLEQDEEQQAKLSVKSLGHVLHAFVNGRLVGYGHGHFRKPSFTVESTVPLNKGANQISLLSATVGLPNSGAFLERRSLGIRSVMIQADKRITDFSWGYQVGLLGEKLQIYTSEGAKNVNWSRLGSLKQLTWYKSIFDAPKGVDPVTLNLGSMGKGEAWVNGQSIGRYWLSFHTSEGVPSQTWYNVPRAFLKPKDNVLVLFEEETGNPLNITIDTISITKVCVQVIDSSPAPINSWSKYGTSMDHKLSKRHHTGRRPKAQLSCPPRRKISKILFASFGDPIGDCNKYAMGLCHSSNSKAIVEKACLGKRNCTVVHSSKEFGGDPCPGIHKSLLVDVQCE